MLLHLANAIYIYICIDLANAAGDGGDLAVPPRPRGAVLRLLLLLLVLLSTISIVIIIIISWFLLFDCYC